MRKCITTMLRTSLTLTAASFLSFSCREFQNNSPEISVSGNVSVPVQLYVQEFDDECGNETKGYLEDAQALISDINYIVYDENGYLVESASRYEDEVNAEESITLPHQGQFEIYAFANVGNLSGSFPAREKDLETFGYRYSSYDEIKEKGLPMAARLHCEADGQSSTEIILTRLATRVALTFDKSEIEQRFRAGTQVTSIEIRQGALDVYPFASGGSRATVATGGSCTADCALSSGRNDIKTINDGGTIYLYVLTNMQGVILPEDYCQEDKTEEMIEMYMDSDEYGLLTYIEMHCKVDTPNVIYDDVTYRHYIGGSSLEGPDNYNCSFNIYPGKHRDIALCLSGGDIVRQNWRLEPGKGRGKSGVIRIVPQATYPIVAPADPMRESTTGVTATMEVTHPSGLAYKVEIDDNSMGLRYSKSRINDTRDRFIFSTDKLVRGSYILPCDTDSGFPDNEEEFPPNVRDVKVTFRAVDIDYAESIDILCMNAFLGCFYTLDADAPVISVYNRSGLTFSCSLNAAIRSDRGGTSETGMGANPFTFSVKPKWGEEEMFAQGRVSKGYYASGTHIRTLFDMGGKLNGACANLEIYCKEYPGLVIKYGEAPLEYYKSSGNLLMYKPLRMSYRNGEGRQFIQTRTIGPNQQPLTWLKANWQEHYVNGNPEIKTVN